MSNNEVAVVDPNANALEAMMAGLDTDFDRSAVEELQPENSFLPYMRLVQGQSTLKDPPFDFEEQDFSLHRSKTEIDNMGKELDIIFIAVRVVAMNFNGKTPQITDNPRSDEFKEWRELAESKNPDIRHGYMWGYEFLVWLGNEGTFATWFLSNASGRRFARYDILGTKSRQPLLRKTLTVWSEKIEDEQEDGRKYRYQVLKHRMCNTPFANAPDIAYLEETVTKFKEGRLAQEAAPDPEGVATVAADAAAPTIER